MSRLGFDWHCYYMWLVVPLWVWAFKTIRCRWKEAVVVIFGSNCNVYRNRNRFCSQWVPTYLKGSVVLEGQIHATTGNNICGQGPCELLGTDCKGHGRPNSLELLIIIASCSVDDSLIQVTLVNILQWEAHVFPRTAAERLVFELCVHQCAGGSVLARLGWLLASSWAM